MFGLSELGLILLVVVVVLGVRKLPGLVRAAGIATRVFQRESTAAPVSRPARPSPYGPVLEGEIVPPEDRAAG